MTDPFVGYRRQVIITTEGNFELIRNELRLAEKYPDNTTIVHMDKNGNYKVVYGLKLDQIPKGDLKVIINGHGELGKINNRGVDEIAQYISTIERATGEDSSIRKVSLISCDLGREYAIKLLSRLQKRGISKAKVSVRLVSTSVLPDGRKTTVDSADNFRSRYRSDAFKKTYSLP
jgi:hypothetical protein